MTIRIAIEYRVRYFGLGYEQFKLICAIKKFNGKHNISIKRYKLSVTHITSDLFSEKLYRA